MELFLGPTPPGDTGEKLRGGGGAFARSVLTRGPPWGGSARSRRTAESAACDSLFQAPGVFPHCARVGARFGAAGRPLRRMLHCSRWCRWFDLSGVGRVGRGVRPGSV